LLGNHNLQNMVFAYELSLQIIENKQQQIIDLILNFKGLEHRLEFVAEHNSVRFFNDSKATNAEATKQALEVFDKNIIWIVGGIEKEEGIKPLQLHLKRINTVLLIGQSQESFANFLETKVEYKSCNDLEQAFTEAVHLSKTIHNSVVLLSPACASWDQWKNFEQRGNAFKQLVHNYIKKTNV